MSCKKPIAWALAASAMMAASTVSYGQAGGQSTPPSGQSNTAERVRETAQPGAAGAPGAASAAGAAAQGAQVDQQLMQQYQQISSDPKTAPAKLFLLDAAMHNMDELAISQQAMQKSQNQQVKQIAQQMVQDHQKMAEAMKPVAQQLGVQPPTGLPSLKQQKIQAMGSLDAEQFDKKYISHMYAAHAHDVAAFEAASQMDNPQVKQFATQQLPTLKQHKQHVTQAAMSMKVIGADAGEAQPAGARMPGRSGSETPATETPRSGSGSGSGTSTGSGSGSGSSGSGTGGTGSGTGSGTGGTTPR